VIAGAAGVGKTRLLREALRIAAGSGRPTAHATATEAARTIPLGAFSHLLPPESTRKPTTLDLLRHARADFGERAGRGPIVLGVDDAHLLDPASATLLLQLVSGGAAFAFATLRTGEPAPDAVTALWKDESCATIELQPVSRAEASSLLVQVLGGAIDGRTEHALWEASRGTPLLLRELVLDGLERGVLVESDGLWSWHGELGGGRRLHELVSARIGNLDDAERNVLELVALGEPLPASWLDEAAPVDALVRRHVLQARRDGRRIELRFAHPLHGEVVRAQMPATRATQVWATLANALESCGARRRGDVLRLATWRLESGGELSADVLVGAAHRAELAFAPALAERFARAAEHTDGGFAASPTGHFRTFAQPGSLPPALAYRVDVEDVFATEDAPPAGWMRAIFDGGPYHDDVGRCVPGPPAPTTLTVSDGAAAGVHLLPAYSRLDRCTAAPMRSN
jgi:hypothetical protein